MARWTSRSFQSVSHFETVDARHHDVGHDHVEVLVLDSSERLLAVPGRGDPVSLGGQGPVQDVLDRGLVVNHEDRRGHSWDHL